MPKFVFRMQSVLNLKVQIEDNLKNELGKATKKLEDEKRVLRLILEEQEECMNKMSSDSSKGIRVDKLQKYSSYISHLKDKAEYQKENINKALQIVDKYREQLIKAMQEREILEKLREKKFKEFMENQIKDEQLVSDEIVNFKYTNDM
jgi:flagellar FliJ protein